MRTPTPAQTPDASERRSPAEAARSAAENLRLMARTELAHTRGELNRTAADVRIGRRTYRAATGAGAIGFAAVTLCLLRLLALGATPLVAGLAMGTICAVACAALALGGRRRLDADRRAAVPAVPPVSRLQPMPVDRDQDDEEEDLAEAG